MPFVPWSLLPDAAWGHGGEDHGAPPAPVSAASGPSWSTWSTEFEAVIRLPADPTDPAGVGHLFVADFATSAPVEGAQVDLTLHGAADLHVATTPEGAPGVWTFPAGLPTAGTFTAALQVLTEARADALGFPAATVGVVEEPDHDHDTWPVAASVGLALAALVLGIALGALLARRRGAAVAGGLALALAVAAVAPRTVSAHGGEEHEAPPPATPTAAGGAIVLPMESQFLLSLRTQPAVRRTVAERVDAVGTTLAPPGDRAEITAPVTGWFLPGDAGLVPGTRVGAGESIGRIVEMLPGADRATFSAARSQAFVALAEAERAQVLAERDAARAPEVTELLSERERLDRTQRVEVAREQVRQARATVDRLRQGLPTTVLTAPIAGRISLLIARPGDLVQTGTRLLTLVDDVPLWVGARLPTAIAAHVEDGASAIVFPDHEEDAPLEARVLDPGSEADPLTGTALVTLALEAPRSHLVPGATVRASITVGAAREALVVPDAAVVDAAGLSLVFVKVGPESFVERPVRVGARSGDVREILAGLDEGERVVVQSTYALRSLAGR